MRIGVPYGESAPPTQTGGAMPGAAPSAADEALYDRDLQQLMRDNDEFEYDQNGEGAFEDDGGEDDLVEGQTDDDPDALEDLGEDEESLNERAEAERTQTRERQDAARRPAEREQVSPRANERIRQLVEKQRVAEERAQQLEKAAALRMTPEEYGVAKLQASSNGFGDVETFVEARSIAAESEQRLANIRTLAMQAEQELNETYNFQPPPAQLQLIRTQRDQAMQAEQSNRQAAIQFHRSTSVMRESQRLALTGIIESAERSIGKLAPGVRRAVESQSPENARMFLDALTEQIRGSNANDRAKYAARLKDKSRRIPPEGTRQGAPPPTYDRNMADNRTPAQRMKAVGSMGLSDLIFDAARQAAAQRRGRR